MADFLTAFAFTSNEEGGYVNDPVDAGGETYRGIARNKHPDWSGWSIIDALKPLPASPRDIDQMLAAIPELQDSVILDSTSMLAHL